MKKEIAETIWLFVLCLFAYAIMFYLCAIGADKLIIFLVALFGGAFIGFLHSRILR